MTGSSGGRSCWSASWAWARPPWARLLAVRLEQPFLDSDAEIERRTGLGIAELFARHGEAEFRRLEHAVICQLLQGPPVVLATGGGAFLDRDTRDSIRRQRGVGVAAGVARPDDLPRRRRSRPPFAERPATGPSGGADGAPLSPLCGGRPDARHERSKRGRRRRRDRHEARGHPAATQPGGGVAARPLLRAGRERAGGPRRCAAGPLAAAEADRRGHGRDRGRPAPAAPCWRPWRKPASRPRRWWCRPARRPRACPASAG